MNLLGTTRAVARRHLAAAALVATSVAVVGAGASAQDASPFDASVLELRSQEDVDWYMASQESFESRIRNPEALCRWLEARVKPTGPDNTPTPLDVADVMRDHMPIPADGLVLAAGTYCGILEPDTTARALPGVAEEEAPWWSRGELPPSPNG